MKVELGQFYLHGETVYVFSRETKDSLRGTAFQNGRAYSVGIDKRKETPHFIPIDPSIARIVQSATPIDTTLV